MSGRGSVNHYLPYQPFKYTEPDICRLISLFILFRNRGAYDGGRDGQGLSGGHSHWEDGHMRWRIMSKIVGHCEPTFKKTCDKVLIMCICLLLQMTFIRQWAIVNKKLGAAHPFQLNTGKTSHGMDVN